MSCLLHILNHSKLINYMAKIFQEQDAALITELFCVNEDDVVNEWENMKGAHIVFA